MKLNEIFSNIDMIMNMRLSLHSYGYYGLIKDPSFSNFSCSNKKQFNYRLTHPLVIWNFMYSYNGFNYHSYIVTNFTNSVSFDSNSVTYYGLSCTNSLNYTAYYFTDIVSIIDYEAIKNYKINEIKTNRFISKGGFNYLMDPKNYSTLVDYTLTTMIKSLNKGCFLTQYMSVSGDFIVYLNKIK